MYVFEWVGGDVVGVWVGALAWINDACMHVVRYERVYTLSLQASLPGMTRSSGPSITAVKRSVVGSGPIRCPGKSRPMR